MDAGQLGRGIEAIVADDAAPTRTGAVRARTVTTERERRDDATAPSAQSPWSRREHARLTTGRGCFAADMELEGQLWLRVVRSPVGHGVLGAVDIEEARRLDGVRAILTARELPTIPHIPLRIMRSPQLQSYLQPVLAADRVRYVGEPVAVVVADSPRIAEDAAELVMLDIEPLAAGLAIDRDDLNAVWPEPGDVMCSFGARVGDWAHDLERADEVVTEEFYVERDTGLPLETRAIVARWTDDGESVELWGPAKFLRFTRNTIADWFGLPSQGVICHHVDVGGMFGVRGEVYPEDFLVPWAARVTGRPVKWVEDRQEHMLTINHSRGQRHRVTVAADRDGRFTCLKVESAVDMGAYARPIGGRVVEGSVEFMPGPYDWPSFAIVSRGIATNKTPTGTMRAPSTFDTTFARERTIDILADRLGIDPIELRRRNLIAADKIPFFRDFGDEIEPVVYDSGDYGKVVDALLADIDYPTIRSDVAARRAAGERVGIGVAFLLSHSGLGAEESVKMDLSVDGRFTVFTTGSEVGQGIASMVARVAAEELGVPEHLVDVVTNQTHDFDGGNGTFCSRSTIFVGSATRDAAAQMRVALKESGRSSDHTSPSAWSAIAPKTVVGRHASKEPTFGFSAQLAVVTVDPDTLHVTVERLSVGYDCGRVVDRPSAVGQIVGGAIQGLGGTLLQELVFDDRGQPTATTFMDFLVPTIEESVHVDVTLLEMPGTTVNPLGVKGIGETGTMGVGGAVGNAVCHALDAPLAVRSLPIHGDDLLDVVPASGAEPARPLGEAGSAALDPGPAPGLAVRGRHGVRASWGVVRRRSGRVGVLFGCAALVAVWTGFRRRNRGAR